MWIATARHSKEIDRRAQQEFGISSEALMEEAGMQVFKALPSGSSLVVFCGQGNNGGDGFVVATLAARTRWQVTCLVAASESALSPDAARELGKARRVRVKVVFADEPGWTDQLEKLDDADVIVDALLGTGSRGVLEGAYLQSVLAMNEADTPVISIDIPTGIEADTGQVMGEAVWAHTTVTFGLPKPCFFTGEGPDHAGIRKVAEIGFPPELLNEPTDAFLVKAPWVSERLPVRWHTSHKGSSGHVAIVAGSIRYRGAAVLACMGALRAGAGLVSVVGIEEVCAAVAAQLPEVILHPVQGENGAIAPSADASEALARADAVVFGPGLTLAARGFLERVWNGFDKPAVIDADALNLVADGLPLPSGPCVLTPHPGEFARLTGMSIREIESDRFAKARSFKEKVTLLKGAHSIICDNDRPRPLAVCPAGNPGMATGGMGDVLSGVVGTFLAQGMDPYEAAACAATLHAEAGDICAESIGPIGYSPRDLALALPAARAKITSP